MADDGPQRDVLAISNASCRSRSASANSVKPNSSAYGPITQFSSGVAGSATSSRPSSTDMAPATGSGHSPDRSRRSPSATAIAATPLATAQTAKILVSASAVNPGARNAKKPTPILTSASNSKRPKPGTPRDASAATSASAPSTAAYAPNSITRPRNVIAGSRIA